MTLRRKIQNVYARENRSMRATSCRKRVFIAVTASLLSLGCIPQSGAQDHGIKHSVTTPPPLEQRCKQLGEESGDQYELRSGIVIQSRKEFSTSFCVTQSCYDARWGVFCATLQPLIESSENPQFRIYGPIEPFDEIHRKPLYMETGRTYEFCARQIPKRDNQDYSHEEFQVDINTIHEIDTGE